MLKSTLLDFGVKDIRPREAEMLISGSLKDTVKVYSCDVHLSNDPHGQYRHHGCPPLPKKEFCLWLRKEFEDFTNITFYIYPKPINQLKGVIEDMAQMIEAEGFKVETVAVYCVAHKECNESTKTLCAAKGYTCQES